MASVVVYMQSMIQFRKNCVATAWPNIAHEYMGKKEKKGLNHIFEVDVRLLSTDQRSHRMKLRLAKGRSITFVWLKFRALEMP